MIPDWFIIIYALGGIGMTIAALSFPISAILKQREIDKFVSMVKTDNE